MGRVRIEPTGKKTCQSIQAQKDPRKPRLGIAGDCKEFSPPRQVRERPRRGRHRQYARDRELLRLTLCAWKNAVSCGHGPSRLAFLPCGLLLLCQKLFQWLDEKRSREPRRSPDPCGSQPPTRAYNTSSGPFGVRTWLPGGIWGSFVSESESGHPQSGESTHAAT